MTEQEFKDRTQQVAIRVIRLIETLPRKYGAQIIGKQLLRSATSVGANYRAACRGKSTADLINKLSIVEEEADETLYWIELLKASDFVPERMLSDLRSEVDQIIAMIVSSIKTLRAKSLANPKSKIRNRNDFLDRT